MFRTPRLRPPRRHVRGQQGGRCRGALRGGATRHPAWNGPTGEPNEPRPEPLDAVPVAARWQEHRFEQRRCCQPGGSISIIASAPGIPSRNPPRKDANRALLQSDLATWPNCTNFWSPGLAARTQSVPGPAPWRETSTTTDARAVEVTNRIAAVGHRPTSSGHPEHQVLTRFVAQTIEAWSREDQSPHRRRQQFASEDLEAPEARIGQWSTRLPHHVQESISRHIRVVYQQMVRTIPGASASPVVSMTGGNNWFPDWDPDPDGAQLVTVPTSDSASQRRRDPDRHTWTRPRRAGQAGGGVAKPPTWPTWVRSWGRPS